MRFVDWMFTDWVELILRTDQETFLISGLSLGAIGTGMLIDETMQESLRDIQSGSIKTLLKSGNRFGDPEALPAASLIFLASLASNNDRFQDASFTSVQSVIYSGVIWTSLKFIIGRQRPEEGNGAFEFSFFDQDNNSLPSGHTGTAFALVTPWIHYIDHPASNVLYALPVTTALARQHLDKHWLSDTIAGGLIGYYVGSRLTRLHRSGDKGRISLSMSLHQGHMLPSLRIKL